MNLDHIALFFNLFVTPIIVTGNWGNWQSGQAAAYGKLRSVGCRKSGTHRKIDSR